MRFRKPLRRIHAYRNPHKSRVAAATKLLRGNLSLFSYHPAVVVLLYYIFIIFCV